MLSREVDLLSCCVKGETEYAGHSQIRHRRAREKRGATQRPRGILQECNACPLTRGLRGGGSPMGGRLRFGRGSDGSGGSLIGDLRGLFGGSRRGASFPAISPQSTITELLPVFIFGCHATQKPRVLAYNECWSLAFRRRTSLLQWLHNRGNRAIPILSSH